MNGQRYMSCPWGPTGSMVSCDVLLTNHQQSAACLVHPGHCAKHTETTWEREGLEAGPRDQVGYHCRYGQCVADPCVGKSSSTGTQPCPFVSVVSGGFHPITAELRSCDRDGQACEAYLIYCLALPLQKNICQSVPYCDKPHYVKFRGGAPGWRSR